jgi:hypothetical protein
VNIAYKDDESPNEDKLLMAFFIELRENALVPGFPKGPYTRKNVIDIFSKMIW